MSQPQGVDGRRRGRPTGPVRFARPLAPAVGLTDCHHLLDCLAGAETSEELTAALVQLTPSQRRVLLLRFFSDMTFEEIAATMNCPLGTALSHCRRGLIAMRKLLTTSEQ